MKTDPKTIRILAYGDSNTWGRVPGDNNHARHPENIRWTGFLQKLLGDKYEVIEEGLNGRTTNIDSPDKAGKNGKIYLFSCLESQKPLDIVILALGKNDLKAKFHRTPNDIAQGLEECIEMLKLEGKNREMNIPKLIILSPGIVEEVERLRFGKNEIDFLGAKEKSKRLPSLYKKIADKNNAVFIDLSKVVKVSDIDGVHLDASEHKKIGELIYKTIRNITL